MHQYNAVSYGCAIEHIIAPILTIPKLQASHVLLCEKSTTTPLFQTLHPTTYVAWKHPSNGCINEKR
jgi:hypothetical protein